MDPARGQSLRCGEKGHLARFWKKWGGPFGFEFLKIEGDRKSCLNFLNILTFLTFHSLAAFVNHCSITI